MQPTISQTNQFATEQDAIDFLNSKDWMACNHNDGKAKWTIKSTYYFVKGETKTPDFYPVKQGKRWRIRRDFHFAGTEPRSRKSGVMATDIFQYWFFFEDFIACQAAG